MRSQSIPAASSEAATTSPRFARVMQVLEEAICDRAFPGAALCVTHQNQVVLDVALGRFTYEPTSALVTPRTCFDLASLTKVLAGTAAAMLLYERGVFLLDQPVIGILPAFDSPADPRRRKITLAMLLSHSSGLPGYRKLYQVAKSREKLISLALETPLEAAPGTRAEYSDVGFIVLTAAIEQLTGERLDTFCAKEIFATLGVPDLRYSPPANWRELIPPSEDDREFRKTIVQGVVQDENASVMDGVSAHAGLFGCAADVSKFGELMLRSLSGEPSVDGKMLCHRETLELFTTRCTVPRGTSRALGWDTPSQPSSSGKYFSRRSFGHLGFSGTSLWIDPEKRLTVTLLTNRCWPSRDNEKIRQVRPRVHDAVIEALDLASPLTKE